MVIISGHSLILFMILQPLARIESVQCTTDYRSTKASAIYQFASFHPLYPSAWQFTRAQFTGYVLEHQGLPEPPSAFSRDHYISPSGPRPKVVVAARDLQAAPVRHLHRTSPSPAAARHVPSCGTRRTRATFAPARGTDTPQVPDPGKAGGHSRPPTPPGRRRPATSPRAATQPAHAGRDRFLKPAVGFTAAKAQRSKAGRVCAQVSVISLVRWQTSSITTRG